MALQINRLLREPLLHFLLLGAAFFAIDAFLAKSDSGGPAKIVVTQQQIENLAADYQRTWGRAPNPEELIRLVDNRVLDEVLFREGVALGLDQDDAVIQRRVRQKMELLADDFGALGNEPTDAELQAYLAKHGGRFAVEPRFSFRQAHLAPRAGRNVEAESARLLESLRQVGDSNAAEKLGDATQLGYQFEEVSRTDIDRTFGPNFSDRVEALSDGRWEGPVRSTYGLHFVLVTGRHAGRLPALSEVREAVKRELAREKQQIARESYYRQLLRHYEVEIEYPRVAAVR